MNENNLIGRILFLGNYSFFLEIFFALIILLIHGKKRKYFPLFLFIVLIGGFPFYFLPEMNFLSFDYSYLLIFLFVFLCGLLLYKEKIFTLFFSCMAAWGVQHISWNLLGILYDLLPNVSSYSDSLLRLIYFLCFLSVYAFSLILFLKLNLKISYNKHDKFSFLLSMIILISTIYLSQSITTWSIPIRIYTMLVAFLSLIIMIIYPYLSSLRIKEKELSDEKENLERMVSLQAKQQALSKEATDLLNMKFHDMKHQLLLMRSMDENKRDETTKEIEKSIDLYTDIARTGNDALDIVITQKSLLCTSKDIRFTYILSGECLFFMNKSDLTSLFGNILDNAIEAASKEEGEYRIIKLKAYQQNAMVLIQEENYAHQKVSFDKSGLPVSTKGDPNYHGFGSKSISYITEKYHGHIHFTQQDDVFSLSIMLPIQEKAPNVSE